MTRTVIERRNILLFVTGTLLAIFFACGIALIFVSQIVHALVIFIVTAIWSTTLIIEIRQGKTMIVVDDSGLTLNGHVKLGPIPWDCISGISIHSVMLDKILTLYVTDIPKLMEIFGEESIRKKIIKKSSESIIQMELGLCKLKGIDLEMLIKRHVRDNRN